MAKRRTKIIATLGPASDDKETLCGMIEAGVDLVRLNFSHGSFEDHKQRADNARDCARQLQREIAIIGDLQGPKIRIARFKQDKVTLTSDQKFTLDADLADDAGDEMQVGIDYKQLPKDVSAKDILLLDDGRLEFEVLNVIGNKIECRVRVGGELSNNKGINRSGGGLSADALTEKDLQDIKHAAAIGVDYIAVSFPRNAADIETARKYITKSGAKHCSIIAKIERSEAVDVIDEIINVSDAIMVARGDLGVEIGDAQVPGVQKHIIQRARALDKAVITATQMMESMITASIPTRAEVSDVANAVLDGTDAVMLSAETAVGDHPVKVVQAMSRVCLGAERNPLSYVSNHRMECEFKYVDEAIAMATMYTANHLKIKAIISLTESGSTPLWMSRIRSGISIYGLTRNPATHRKMLLYRGVYPVAFDPTEIERHNVNKASIDCVQQHGFVATEDLVIITKGDSMGTLGGTNALKIVKVGGSN